MRACGTNPMYSAMPEAMRWYADDHLRISVNFCSDGIDTTRLFKWIGDNFDMLTHVLLILFVLTMVIKIWERYVLKGGGKTSTTN